MLCSVLGPDTSNHDHLSISSFKQPLNLSDQLTSTLTSNNLSLCSLSGKTGSVCGILSKHINNSNTSECDPDLISHLIHNSVSDESLLIHQANSVSNTSTESSTGHKNELVESQSKEMSNKEITVV